MFKPARALAKAWNGSVGPPRPGPTVALFGLAMLLAPVSASWAGPQLVESTPIHRDVEQITTLNHAPVTTIAVVVGRADTQVNTSSAPGRRVVVLTKPIVTVAIWGRVSRRIAS